jgi:Protein of unknown function (DUF4242)
MARYVVERTFSGLLRIPMTAEGAAICRSIVERNADEGATWLHSYVCGGGTKTFCIYDAPTPESIRKAAHANELPVEHISEVRILTPYFYA